MTEVDRIRTTIELCISSTTLALKASGSWVGNWKATMAGDLLAILFIYVFGDHPVRDGPRTHGQVFSSRKMSIL